MNSAKNKTRKPKSNRMRNCRLKQKYPSALQFEMLEPKYLLAAITVSNNTDLLSSTADVSSVSALIANDGGDGISLREAIIATNNSAGEDAISFDASAFSGGANSLIRLTQGQLEITDSLSIDGSSVAGVVITGDAGADDITFAGTYITDVEASFGEDAGDPDDLLDDNSRVLNFSNASANLSLTNLTITGGRTTGDDEDGGGIRSLGDLSLIDSDVSGNSTTGRSSRGGGISAASGNVSLIDSTVNANRTAAWSFYAADGGAISVARGSLSLLNGMIVGNFSGDDGGGLYVRGNLSLVSTTVSGNESGANGGGVFASGTISLTDSAVSENTSGFNGGGLFGRGTITVLGSTVSDNVARGAFGFRNFGGGIWSLGDLSITNSTVSGNSALASPFGNPFGGGYGGGISANGNLTLTNSTVSENTVLGSGGGIDFDGSLALYNSIVSGNTAGNASPDVTSNFGSVSNLIVEHSLIGDTSDSGITAASGSGNILDQPALLGPLADNGGATLTHALLPGSPAIDAGNNERAVDENGNPLITDQRDNGRIGAATVDLGAVEFDTQTPVVLGDVNLDSSVNFSDIQPFISLLGDGSFQDEADVNRDGIVSFLDVGPFIDLLVSTSPTAITGSLVVTTNLDVVDPADGLNSLREAIAFANNPAAGASGDGDADGDGLTSDTVTFDASVFTGGPNNLIRLTQGELSITDDLIIDGASAGGVLITGDADGDDVTVAGTSITDAAASFGGTIGAADDLLDDNSRVLNISPGLADLTLERVTITGGRTSDSEDGAGIRFRSHGSLKLIDSNVSGNQSDGEGGGVFSIGDTFLANTTLSDNVSRGDGGGLSANNAIGYRGDGDPYGGSLGSMLNFDASLVSGNTSIGAGGGVSASSLVSFNHTIVSGNSSGFQGNGRGEGGGVSVNGEVTFNHSIVSGNGSSSSGGGVSANGKVTFNHSTVSNNSSGFLGGGISVGGDLLFNYSTVSGNGSSSSGGGVSAVAGEVTFNHSTASDNSSGQDGGGVRIFRANATLANSTLSGNSSGEDGGGLYLGRETTVRMANSTVTQNLALGIGGGISSREADSHSEQVLRLHNSIVSGNTDDGTAPDVQAADNEFNDLTVEHSLIGDTTGSSITTATGTGNILNQPALLGPLADNGGATLTHALLPDSPAIDAGNNALAVDENGNPLVTDQRGATRVGDGTVDIGAYEFENLFVLGDVNLDSVVDFADISPFINLLSTNSFQDEADTNRNGVLDFADIGSFISLLSGGSTEESSDTGSLLVPSAAEETLSASASLFESDRETLDEIFHSPFEELFTDFFE